MYPSQVAVRTERSMKGKYCSDHLKKVTKAKTSVVVSTTKLECSIYKCIQQTADAEVVGTNESINDSMESDANGQIANKDNELNQSMSFQIGDEVKHCISHGDISKTAKDIVLLLYLNHVENTYTYLLV